TTTGRGTRGATPSSPSPRRRRPPGRRPTASAPDRWVAVEGEGETQPDHRTATRAVAMLEAQKGRDGPFFLAVGFLKPHVPFIAPKTYFDLYDPSKIALPADFAPRPTASPGAPEIALRPNFDLFINREPSPEQAREAIAAYH